VAELTKERQRHLSSQEDLQRNLEGVHSQHGELQTNHAAVQVRNNDPGVGLGEGKGKGGGSLCL